MIKCGLARLRDTFTTVDAPDLFFRLSPSLISIDHAMGYGSHSRLIAAFWHFARHLVREPEPQLLRFSNSNFKTLPSHLKVEEETHDALSKGKYYPIRIGDVIVNKYQVVGKLGYGIGSTVWLANETQ